mmetsp:Transcript_35908/g.90452  ORF Transcript_35908/g.90452 Transcript_35908/m.90452 type:complete len:237 (+) Transcript_35908:787-1497(+)
MPVRRYWLDKGPMWVYMIYNESLASGGRHLTLLSDADLMRNDPTYELSTRHGFVILQGVKHHLKFTDGRLPTMDLLIGEEALHPEMRKGGRPLELDVDAALYKEERTYASLTKMSDRGNNKELHRILHHWGKRTILETLAIATWTDHLPPPTPAHEDFMCKNCPTCSLVKLNRPAVGSGNLGLSFLYAQGPQQRPGQTVSFEAEGPFPPSVSGMTYLGTLVDIGTNTVVVGGSKGL